MRKILLLTTALLLVGASEVLADYRQSFTDGRKAQGKKQWEEAGKHFTKAAEQARRSNQEADAWREAADCYIECRKFNEARNAFAQITKLVDLPTPDLVEAYKNIANTYIEQKKYGEAFETMMKCRTIPGISADILAEIHLYIAEYAKKNNMPQERLKAYKDLFEAIAKMKKVRGNGEKVAQARWEYAQLCVANGDMDTAIEVLKAHRNDKITPDRRREVCNKLREAYIGKDDYEGAAAAMNELLDVKDLSSDDKNQILSDIGAFYYGLNQIDKIGKLADAVATDKKSIKNATRRAFALQVKGELLMLGNRSGEALDELYNAAVLTQDAQRRFDCCNLICQSAKLSGEYDKGLDLIKRILAEDKGKGLLKPDKIMDIHRKRIDLSETGNKITFVPIWEEALGLPGLTTRQKSDIYWSIGELYSKAEQHLKSAEAYSKAMKLLEGSDPNRIKDLTNRYVDSLCRAGMHQKAFEALPTLLKLQTEAWRKYEVLRNASDRFVDKLYGNNRWQKLFYKNALEALKMVNIDELKDDQKPDYFLRVGGYYRRFGQKDFAIRAYREVMDSPKANGWQKDQAKRALSEIK